MRRKIYLMAVSGVLALLCLLSPRASSARTGRPSLAFMAHTSHVIVLAEVEKVSSEGGTRVASARVLEVWKGSPPAEVSFRASRTWACDISTAVEGERAVLFLTENPGAPFMSLTYHGWGRVPVARSGGREQVLVPMPVGRYVPGQAAMMAAANEPWIGSVEVATLKGHVDRLLREVAEGAERAE